MPSEEAPREQVRYLKTDILVGRMVINIEWELCIRDLRVEMFLYSD
jgi:hypothetical protein